jgi:hypothetical protein
LTGYPLKDVAIYWQNLVSAGCLGLVVWTHTIYIEFADLANHCAFTIDRYSMTGIDRLVSYGVPTSMNVLDFNEQELRLSLSGEQV